MLTLTRAANLESPVNLMHVSGLWEEAGLPTRAQEEHENSLQKAQPAKRTPSCCEASLQKFFLLSYFYSFILLFFS